MDMLSPSPLGEKGLRAEALWVPSLLIDLWLDELCQVSQ